MHQDLNVCIHFCFLEALTYVYVIAFMAVNSAFHLKFPCTMQVHITNKRPRETKEAESGSYGNQRGIMKQGPLKFRDGREYKLGTFTITTI